MMIQHIMCELKFNGPLLTKDWAKADIDATIASSEEEIHVKGFYAGDGCYKVRFLPRHSGIYTYCVRGCVHEEGTVEIAPASFESHGMVHAEGPHFYYADGTLYTPFGTTVYALTHQPQELVNETIDSLKASPFNKIRLCVFPKHFDYNQNEPSLYPFEKNDDGSWDVSRPSFEFWDDFEEKMMRIASLGFQIDLILFHPYDRWGFATLSQDENMTYLDYLLRRLAAYPFFWWSMSNEYDICYPAKDQHSFEEIEDFIYSNDPYHHLLSNHNCFTPWDFSREHITHISYQTKSIHHVSEWIYRWKKPVCIDECGYEGNIPQTWGAISGRTLTSRFWQAMVQGGYCTHGETYYNEKEILWWSRGGKLVGESPARIAWLRKFMESLPGPITPQIGFLRGLIDTTPEEFALKANTLPPVIVAMAHSAWRMTQEAYECVQSEEHLFKGVVGDDEVIITLIDNFCPASYGIDLPEDKHYRVDVLDIWNMTQKTVLAGAHGNVMVPLPGTEGIVIAAFREEN